MDKSQRSYQLFIQEDFSKIIEGTNGVSDPAPGIMMELGLPFTIEFDITRSTLSSTNTSTIKVYNMSKSRRSKVYKDQYAYDKYKAIELRAGYGDVMPTVFKGNITRAFSSREGTAMITTIESLDGGFGFVNGRVNKSFSKGFSNNSILDEIISSLPGIKKGKIGSFPGALRRGNALNGPSIDLADALSGGKFFVDNEKGFFLNDDEYTLGDINLITSTTGLLGTPKREESMLHFDMIFEPRLLVGQGIQLQSSTVENFNGFFKVVSIKHRGMISESVCGSAITSVGLWAGTSELTPVF
jgi:hypothetical protein